MQLTLGKMYLGVLIPSLYATSPRTRCLRPVMFHSDQNIRWRLPFPLSTDKRQESIISPNLPDTLYEMEYRRDATHIRQLLRIFMLFYCAI